MTHQQLAATSQFQKYGLSCSGTSRLGAEWVCESCIVSAQIWWLWLLPWFSAGPGSVLVSSWETWSPAMDWVRPSAWLVTTLCSG